MEQSLQAEFIVFPAKVCERLPDDKDSCFDPSHCFTPEPSQVVEILSFLATS